ncbi:hypothetical protein [Arthrobacter sp. UM1]|uniref:hypothetical protein n=1 Tax=Arthrobacter sp. UM1 TaxID=2766776 RepID=UPI001CF6DC60|nr:hypothetical protein [Arthrobacter sp. UM1]MCB4208074.1 hypothetical protein [Arthrobacter sp. UM1]
MTSERRRPRPSGAAAARTDRRPPRRAVLVGAAALPFALATGGAWWTTETTARHRAEDQSESASERAARELHAVLTRLEHEDPALKSKADRLARALGVPQPSPQSGAAEDQPATPSPTAAQRSAADGAAQVLRESAGHAEARGRAWQWLLVLSALERPNRDAARLAGLTADRPLSAADQARSASSFAAAARAADTAAAAWTVVAAQGADGQGAGGPKESAEEQRTAWGAAARAVRAANPGTPPADLARPPGGAADAAAAAKASDDAVRALVASAADWPSPAPEKLVKAALAAVREFQAQ